MPVFSLLPLPQPAVLAEGSYPVYTGPGSAYFRAGGDATVGAGSCELYGSQGGFLMIGYAPYEGGYRIGYVEQAAFPAAAVPELVLGSTEMAVTGNTSLTDDPVNNAEEGVLGKLKKGDQVYVLAHMADNDFWAYVEVPGFDNGMPARGFVERSMLN